MRSSRDHVCRLCCPKEEFKCWPHRELRPGLVEDRLLQAQAVDERRQVTPRPPPLRLELLQAWQWRLNQWDGHGKATNVTIGGRSSEDHMYAVRRKTNFIRFVNRHL